ncbi:MAG TPA: hypothetical protein PLQ93_03775 [Bacteroidia bacterium]|nr:hypothetical protein [Bacteroidia bacterium]
MQARFALCILTIILARLAGAQSDSVVYKPENPPADGVYQTYFDFRHNKAILKEDIVLKADPEQLDYVGKAMEKDKLVYRVQNSEYSMATKDVWGYVQNGTFYLNYLGKFYRVPVFGAISYLVAMVEVKQSGFYDPRFGTYSGSTTTYEQREFYLNFYEGRMKELNSADIEKLFSRDQPLYEEYMALSQRKRKEQLYRYIRKFNENNPVYFLN